MLKWKLHFNIKEQEEVFVARQRFEFVSSKFPSAKPIHCKPLMITVFSFAILFSIMTAQKDRIDALMWMWFSGKQCETFWGECCDVAARGGIKIVP